MTEYQKRQILGYDAISGEARPIAVDQSGELKIAVTVADIVLAKISGETVKVSGEVVKVSGETVIAKVSGEVAKISGEVVKVSGETVIAKVSGEVAKISGETIVAKTSGAIHIAKISGETVDIYVPTAIKGGAIFKPTASSGGTIVTSGAIKSATFKSLSGDVYLLGSTPGQMPYSGFGFLLAAGEALSLDLDNFGRARICAPVHSGDWCSYIGIN